jgi:uncharacterized protein with von Willebrand factor type A (vWA) domain
MLLDNLLRFGRVLRYAGLEVHHGRLLDAVRATEWIGVGNRDDVRSTLRALLVHRHEDLARFDAAFDLFFRVHRSFETPILASGHRPSADPSATGGMAVNLEFEHAASEPPADAAVGAYSPLELLRTKDFEAFTAEELHQARLLLAELPWRLGVRRTRRWETARGGAIDLRPVLRRSLMRGGEPIELPRRARRRAPRPIVLLGDVSGSMERYSRMMLQFVYGLARANRRVESFVFATRLTRITSSFPFPPPALRVPDWGGGTRIGEALRTFNTRWARRVMRNGPVVLLVSDGWDRGDPALLARELARLRRSCHRLIWLNPLLGRPGYEPLTRGMRAALGYIDDFFPAHNLASLEALARHLGRLPTGHGHRRHVRL